MLLSLRRPDDFHVHLRQGQALKQYAQDVQNAGFARILVMPNTLPPIHTAQQLIQYKQEIKTFAPNVETLMTFKIKSGLTYENLNDLKTAGAIAGKLYPEGVTTNSEDGIACLEDVYPVFEIMEALDLVLSVHGENPRVFSFDREQEFINDFKQIRKNFPRLKIVLEHISTAKGIQAVLDAGEKTAGTITIQHLLFTFDDLAGGALNTHLFCKPLLKRPEDRNVIEKAVLSGSSSFFFGSDSAPHDKNNKESGLCSAGCYTMPVSLPLLAQFFEMKDSLEKMEAFVSLNGAKFYGLEQNTGTINLVKKDWDVPLLYGHTVPLMAGKKLGWKLED